MSWTLLTALILALLTAYLVLLLRRSELARMASAVDERARARKAGTHAARLQHPHIDLTRCLGCSACISSCPEEGVLALIHGQAAVVHGAHCVGHGHCQQACPTGAITVQLADLEERRDLPALTRSFEAVGVPGLFLAGEITGHSLIRSAIEQGRTVARAVQDACSLDESPDGSPDWDLIVVGSGPAGLACAVDAQARGLRVLLLEQGSFGGTIAHFPRRKLVLTQPVELPGWGLLTEPSYTREELLEIWQEVARREEITVQAGVRFEGLQKEPGGVWQVKSNRREWTATCVCLALGRRGSPTRLQVPGEELSKVQSALLDSRALSGRKILVVGGGDSAVETALALSLQPDNEVTLAHRGSELSRPGTRNRKHLEEAARTGRVRIEAGSQVVEICTDSVRLTRGGPHDPQAWELENDDVFVHIGGSTPIPLLESCGVSFDPEDRRRAEGSLGSHVPHVERQRLLISLATALIAAVLMIVWVTSNLDYYTLSIAERPLAPGYDTLRPPGRIGVTFGVVATLMILVNLAYLLRRTAWIPLHFGRFRNWMTIHVATGILALLLALLHGGMHIGDTPGGHATLALCTLVVTGSIGRYLYAFVPRATSGRNLASEEVQEELRRMSGELEEADGDFAQRIREFTAEESLREHWNGGYARRLWGLLVSRRRLRHALADLKHQARASGRDEAQVQELALLMVRAHRSAQSAAHFEDLRGILSTWRHIHGWMALLLVLIVAAHIWDALRYGDIMNW